LIASCGSISSISLFASLTMVMTLWVMFWAIDGLLDMGLRAAQAVTVPVTMALPAAGGKGMGIIATASNAGTHSWQPRLTGRAARA
jgi:hypothetical protein